MKIVKVMKYKVWDALPFVGGLVAIAGDWLTVAAITLTLWGCVLVFRYLVKE